VLFAGVASGINAIDFQSLICGQGGNELALTSVGVEPPAVVSALDLLSIELPAMQGHAAVRAGVTQGEGLSLTVATQYEGDFQQHCFLKLVAMHAVGWQSAVPEAGEHERIGRLALRGFEFRHGGNEHLRPAAANSRQLAVRRRRHGQRTTARCQGKDQRFGRECHVDRSECS